MKNLTKLIVLILLLILNPVYAIDSGSDITIKQEGNSVIVEDQDAPVPDESAQIQDVSGLPATYDLREADGKSNVTPVKYQDPWNTCWAFATIGAAESNALKKGAQNTDFSERALTYYNYQPQNSEGYSLSSSPAVKNLEYQIGDKSIDPLEQLTTWNGASTEKEVPYENNEKTIQKGAFGSCYSKDGTWSLNSDNLNNNAFHLQNYRRIATNYNFDPRNVDTYTSLVKQEILDHGGIVVGCYLTGDNNFNKETNSEYVANLTYPNHAALIVGWDDNYSPDNFNTSPVKGGAWIVKNSYSSNWGDNGYFYLSYYDQSINEFDSVDIETPETGYTYSDILQHDYTGNKYELSQTCTGEIARAYNEGSGDITSPKTANVFTVDKDQLIKAFSFDSYYNTPTTIKTQIYLLNENATTPDNGKLLATQIDNVNTAGYHTIPFEKQIVIEKGQKFSIVQNIVYSHLVDLNRNIVSLVGLPIAYGLDGTLDINFNNVYTGKNQVCNLGISAQAQPGESFVYGLDGTTSWSDLADEATKDNLKINITVAQDTEGTSSKQVTAIPGNVMTKVYTSDLDPDDVPAMSIQINDGEGEIFLASPQAGPGAKTSQELKATVTPSNSSEPVVWSSSAPMVAYVSAPSGDTVTVHALNEGKAIINAKSGEVSTNLIITVTNQETVCETVEISSDDPSYFTVTAKNVKLNPALNRSGNISNVSIFSWSDSNQADMNAKQAVNIPGTNDWQWKGFPVNDNEAHSYFNNASRILVNIYASTTPDNIGNCIGVAYYSWINYIPRSEDNICYIAYSQNTGFNQPVVYNGDLAGKTDGSSNLEGFRISSNLENVGIESRVHVQELGWLDPVEDGVYAGTMNRNLGIEAVSLKLTGQNSGQFQITYRTLGKDGTWFPWVTDNMIAGTTGQNKQIQAIEIKIVPVNVN